MAKYIHASTSRGPIRVEGRQLLVSCAVDLRSNRGGSQSIEFDVQHTCTSGVNEDELSALLEKVLAQGSELAAAFIAAADVEGR